MYIIYPKQNNEAEICRIAQDEQTEKTALKYISSGIPYIFLNDVDVDWYFYKHRAYDFNSLTGIELNIFRAKEIWLELFRTARAPILAALDVEFIKSLETEDLNKKQEVIVKKQALRDVTKLELPNTLEGIKSMWPEILGQSPFKQ